MKKLLCILTLILLIFLCGCTKNVSVNDNASDYKVILPSDDTVNGYRETKTNSTQSTEEANTEITYYANTKTKKFHISSCAYAKKTATENTYICKDKTELADSGYEPCKVCKP